MSSHLSDTITGWSACGLRRAIDQREVACVEVMAAYLDRIDAVNPAVNAIVSRVDREVLLTRARERDDQLRAGDHQGPLHGFPMAIDDLAATAGVASTSGSKLHARHVPTQDDPTVARMKRAGGIVIGKTNEPEFGLGADTRNETFGLTRNAIEPGRTAGGAGGGGAVSVALRLQPVADGCDVMGALRTPAAFANVFGFRPSMGRVPTAPSADQFVAPLSTEGPMARSVRDLALLLSVQAGRDVRAPLSLDDGTDFLAPLESDVTGLRIGWLGDLKGYLPMDPGVLATCEAAMGRFEALGCRVDTATLGMPAAEVWQTWQAWNGWLTAGRLAPYATDPTKRARLSPQVLAELERGSRLTADDAHAASLGRSRFYQRILGPFHRCDFLALPTSQVWPFAAGTDGPTHIGGMELDSVHRASEVSIYASLAGLPVITVPAGFDAQGLPMGLQLIGRPQADLSVLKLAAAYESTIGELIARPQARRGITA